VLASLISGGLLALGFPPLGLWPLALVALAPLLACLRDVSLSRGWLNAFLGLWVWEVGVLWWLFYVARRFGQLPLGLALAVPLLLAAYLAFISSFFLLLGEALARWEGGPRPLVLSCAWVLGEWVKAHLLGGFPWELLGYTQYRGPCWRALPYGGVMGVSFLVVGTSALLAEARRHPRHLLLLLCLVPVWFLRPPASQAVSRLRVGIVQPNLSPPLKQTQPQRSLERCLKLTLRALSQGAKLVVWPETAFMNTPEAVLPRLRELCRRQGCAILLGCLRRDGAGHLYNSALLVSPQEPPQWYDKRHLVPFGEFVPLRSLFEFLPQLGRIGGFSAGTRPGLLQLGGVRVGVLICYEAIFPWMARQLALRGARLLVNITDDAWFGRTSAPYQHLGLAAARAAELGLPLVRAANTGISAWVDIEGRPHKVLPIFTEGVVVDTIDLPAGLSVYARVGDVLPYLSILVMGICGARLRWRNS